MSNDTLNIISIMLLNLIIIFQLAYYNKKIMDKLNRMDRLEFTSSITQLEKENVQGK